VDNVIHQLEIIRYLQSLALCICHCYRQVTAKASFMHIDAVSLSYHPVYKGIIAVFSERNFTMDNSIRTTVAVLARPAILAEALHSVIFFVDASCFVGAWVFAAR